MTRFALAACLLAALAACGVEGDPMPPSDEDVASGTGSGVTISGDARLGVSGF